jgi:hypothetical protein
MPEVASLWFMWLWLVVQFVQGHDVLKRACMLAVDKGETCNFPRKSQHEHASCMVSKEHAGRLGW